MASGGRLPKHGTSSSDEGTLMQNGFNFPGTSVHQQSIRSLPHSHQDPKRRPQRTQEQEGDVVPYDSDGRSLARDLFCGTETSQSPGGFQYDPSQEPLFTGQRPPGNNNSGKYKSQKLASNQDKNARRQMSGCNSEDRGERSKGRGQRSSGNHSNDDRSLPRNSSMLRKDSEQSQNFERKVQYLEDSLDPDFMNLKITVTEKPKKATRKSSGGGSKSADSLHAKALSPISKCGASNNKIQEGTSQAEKFLNPLLSPKADGKDSRSSTPIKEAPGREIPKLMNLDLQAEYALSELEKKKKKRKKKRKKSSPTEVLAPDGSVASECRLANRVDGDDSAQKAIEVIDDDSRREESTTDGSVMSVSKNETKSNKKEKPETSSDPKEDTADLEKLGLEQAEKRLEKNDIFRLVKKSPKYPNAVYFCHVCSHHIASIALANRHIREKRHKKEIITKQRKDILINYKMPPVAALDVLTRHLTDITAKEMLSHEDTVERENFIRKLNDFIETKVQGCNLVMFGSSVTTFGLKEATINVEVQYSGDMKIPSMLLRLLEILKECEFLESVQEDFNARMPSVTVTDEMSGLVGVLSVYNSKSVQATRLLQLYSAMEAKVVELSKVFRLWGHYCDLDKQQFGTLPAISFPLMAIFYLQQEYKLPALHEVMAEHDIEAVLSQKPGYEEVLKVVDGEWWYYPTAPPVGEKPMNCEIIEEPEETIDLAGESDCDLEITFVETPAEKEEKKEHPLVPTKLSRCFEVHTPSIGQLWIDFLKYFTATFDMENLIISIRSSSRVTRSERGWSHRRLALEDPSCTKWNLCKAMASQSVFTFFQTQLRTSVIYFLTSHEIAERPSKRGDNARLSVLKLAFDELKGKKSTEHDNEKDVEPTDEAELAKIIGEVIHGVISDVESKLDKVLVSYEGCYLFTKKSLMDGSTPVKICQTCKKEGHRRSDCPDEVTFDIKPLPEFTNEMRTIVDQAAKDCFRYFVPRECEFFEREFVCQEILNYLRKNYNDKVCLCLFGSSKNGFTFKESDLDICMTFSGNPTGEGLDYAEIIEELAKSLRKDINLRQIVPITTAKVPIVKFYATKANLEGDISLYNLLAQKNTAMLQFYANLDERCRILGYAIKAFAKHCGIGDASKGSLSSYAYVLLVIYFLQQRDPPVLPVLQELYVGDKRPEIIVDGWNAWFYDNKKNLNQEWSDVGKNTESVGELWLGFLRFYTEQFDFPKHVVAIRQKKLLTAFEKEWTSKFISIEDPFDLNHNLGAGVSRKMAKFITKVFVRARERFGMPAKDALNNCKSLLDYFFEVNFLTDGQEVPNDRCCRVCGRIGHFIKDCPRRKLRKKEDSKRKERECFHCGQKGHYRSNCPQAKKAAREGPIPQSHPHDPYLLVLPPTKASAFSKHCKGQGSPGKQRGWAGSDHSKHDNSLSSDGKHFGSKEWTSKPQNKKNQQPPKMFNQLHFPSGSPQNAIRKKAPNQTYCRSQSDFEYENHSRHGNLVTPQALHFDPRHHSQQNSPRKYHSMSETPGKIHTVTEIESKMKQEASQRQPNFDGNPRQRSHEQIVPTPSQRQPAFHSRPRFSVQHSVPPMESTNPQYIPSFSTSPQSCNNPYFSTGSFPHGGGFSGRTPPSGMPPFFPNHGSPHYPQVVRLQHHESPRGYSGMTHDHGQEPVVSHTFVNSGNTELQREVSFTNPGNTGYRSYPPGPAGYPPSWSRRNM